MAWREGSHGWPAPKAEIRRGAEKAETARRMFERSEFRRASADAAKPRRYDFRIALGLLVLFDLRKERNNLLRKERNKLLR